MLPTYKVLSGPTTIPVGVTPALGSIRVLLPWRVIAGLVAVVGEGYSVTLAPY